MITKVIPAIRTLLSLDKLVTTTLFTGEKQPDCCSSHISVEGENEEDIINSFKSELALLDGTPCYVSIKNHGTLAVSTSAKAAEIMADSKGGNHCSTTSPKGRVAGKIIIVTGGAQGFGAGIVNVLFKEGANIIVADLNESLGTTFVAELNAQECENRARFVKVDVSSPESVESLMEATVKLFGGVDTMISNAGILHAGSLDEMEPKIFQLMTRVNYEGYFYCSKYASAVMKIQSKYGLGNYSDIIQINSKSGLKGSNKNFAYAGGKFGGIGLTQSFALELMPDRIKVNSICPGNFFDGPLWSDPERGLFVQYLKAGKVPGATTVEHVKRFYENQVPARRGCTPLDVVRAIFYVVEQQYETGQAIPVTGGQEMLN